MELLLDGSRGDYLPQSFARLFSMEEWHVNAFDADVLLAGPGHPEYWETWDEVLDNAFFFDPQGRRWILYQDDDLWAVLEDEESPEG